MDCRREELLIAAIARLLEGCRNVAVGMLSPIPGTAAMLARARDPRVRVLGILRGNSFTNGGVELFDLAAQGRLDAFFLGGGQIDGRGNLNLVGTGDYPRGEVRWPGSFGSAFLYAMVPRVILFREEHSRRVLVPEVDFISAPGPAPGLAPGPIPDDPRRRGGPHALLTDRALFTFDRARARFRLDSVHPGHDLDEVIANTGFDFDRPDAVPETLAPDAETLALIRGPVAKEIARTYPRFAKRLFPDTVEAAS
jgi:glutaconate CoA-transferase subunit B